MGIIEKLSEFCSRFPPFGGSVGRLTVEKNIVQTVFIKKRIYLCFIKSWSLIFTSIVVFTNYNNIFLMISQRKLIFKYQGIKGLSILIFLHLVLTVFWELLHSHNSPIERWQLEKLLRGFTEESDLLRQNDNSFNQTKSVKWCYRISDELTTIILMAGGHISFDMEKDIPRRLHSYLVKETRTKWIIEDIKIQNGEIITLFSHKADKRLLIDDLNKLTKSDKGTIQITKRYEWEISKQAQLGIFGKTGSGKTTIIKFFILSFLANNNHNTCFLIDGKNGFLAQAGRFANIPTATNAEECLKLLDNAISVMEQRYSEMNADLSDESDLTYIEKFPNKGSILIVCDELLSLASTTQAIDRTKRPTDRLMPQISDRILNLITKSRQSSISLLLSGQAFPASLLGDSIVRSNLGLLINLGSITQVQSKELFGKNLSEIPRIDTSNFGGLIWLDGCDWELPKPFLSPYYDEMKLPFKATLKKLSEVQGGGVSQA